MMTLHTSGGAAMMRAAREAVGAGKKRPMLLGVTILTSLDAAALNEIGLSDLRVRARWPWRSLRKNRGTGWRGRIRA